MARVRGLRKQFLFEVIAKMKAGTFSFRTKNVLYLKLTFEKVNHSAHFNCFEFCLTQEAGEEFVK